MIDGGGGRKKGVLFGKKDVEKEDEKEMECFCASESCVLAMIESALEVIFCVFMNIWSFILFF